jgi:hypothetical protein
MVLLVVLAQILGWLSRKYPIEAPDPDGVVEAEIEKQRRRGTDLAERLHAKQGEA